MFDLLILNYLFSYATTSNAFVLSAAGFGGRCDWGNKAAS